MKYIEGLSKNIKEKRLDLPYQWQNLEFVAHLMEEHQSIKKISNSLNLVLIYDALDTELPQ